MTSQPIAPQQVVYQAEPTYVQAAKSAKEKLHGIVHHHMNRPVRVQTIDGQVHQGYITHVDDDYLYLRVPTQVSQDQRAFGAYNNVILPLVLYQLLVISLLYT
ncbi:acetyl-CoA acetyltransferase [Paenibacillus hodogayensis]|uniref:Acetyl-CoA acetyltransferase n=1 Tax=Paenibacillus hodogayensis TaxID=279208 RepID=A0ABV5VU16_9BACL